jgi:transposase
MASTENPSTISIPVAEYERLKSIAALVTQLQRDNVKLSDELASLIKRFFGKSSERLDPDQLALFEGALEAAKSDAAKATPKKQGKKTPRKGHGRPTFPDHLPREVIELDVPESERSCSDCGQEMECFGEEITERGHIVPAQLIVKRYVRKKYSCRDGCCVKTPALPGSLVDKGKYEPSVYAHLATAKYGDHLPLHRLSGIYKRYGLKLPKSTMWELLKRLDEVVAQPILTQMRSELLSGSHINADETPVTVRIEDGKGSRNGYIWTYLWKRRVLFDFTMTRQRDGPRTFLGAWKGTLQIDGYSGYDEVARINGLVRAGCWSHARRKVLEAVERGNKTAIPLLRLIGRLFRIERALRVRRDAKSLNHGAFIELRTAVRNRRSQHVLAQIRAEVAELWSQRSTLPKSALGKSLTYLERQWEPLAACINDAELEIHNNDAERALRHVVTGRKNWMFFGSQKGGEVGARLFSLISSCKAMDINPEAYLVDVIAAIDTTPASKIEVLTPWAWAERQAS